MLQGRSTTGYPPALSPVWVTLAATGAFALALQIQFTLFEASSPVRIAASDLLIVALAPLFLIALWRNRRHVRRIALVPWMLLIIAATIVMTVGFATGTAADGITGWALGKYVGWFLLLAYGAYGAMLVFLGDQPALDRFVSVFVWGLAITTLLYLAHFIAGHAWPINNDWRLSGFNPNPNAFGLLMLCGLPFALLRTNRHWSWIFLSGLLCGGALYTRSMATTAGLTMVLVLFPLMFGRLRSVALTVAIAAGLFVAPPAANYALGLAFPDSVKTSKKQRITEKLRAVVTQRDEGEDRLYSASVPSRLQSAREALAMWRDHPLLGSGLGSFFAASSAAATPEKPAMVIHSTPLWILAEFGIVGLGAFGALFGTFGFWLYRNADVSPDVKAGILVLLVWAAMSLPHELMYQRAPWFILGLCAGTIVSPGRRPETAVPR